MRVLFRVDSGTHIGTGHVMRCLTLASALKAAGHDCHFLMRPHSGSINGRVEPLFSVFTLDAGVCDPEAIDPTDYVSWLGVSKKKEISDLSQCVEGNGPFNLVVFDHYGIDSSIEKAITSAKILVVDDLMNREHFCDYLIDQNLSADLEKYQNLNTKLNCKYLLGTKFALLRPEFSSLRSPSVRNLNSVKKIFVFFGGSDSTKETKKVVDALLETKVELCATFVLSEFHNDFKWIYDASRTDKRIRLLPYVSNIAEEMSQSDLCFGGAGTTSWERACLGLPSFVVVVADNQIGVAEELKRSGASIVVGDGRMTTVSDWKTVFESLHDLNRINVVASAAYSICDGGGVNRVLEMLDESKM